MIGAIIGDIAGSRFEFNNYRQKNFKLFGGDDFLARENFGRKYDKCRYTDDTVMTCAVAEALIEYKQLGVAKGKEEETFKQILISTMKKLGKRYPNAGYGSKFYYWVLGDDTKPYNSFGNGSAMRVSPVIWVAESFEECEQLARWSAEVTHNHPEGVKGAVVTAVAGYMARRGCGKDMIRDYIQTSYPDAGTKSWKEIAKTNEHVETCMNALPIAMSAFLEGKNYEDCIKTAIACGGDSDTIAAICGAVAEGFYGVKNELKKEALKFLPQDLKAITVIFTDKYVDKGDKEDERKSEQSVGGLKLQ